MESKRVLVTGASRGIGRSIARRLAISDWSVALHYNVDRSGASSMLDELAAQGSGIYQADLSTASTAEAALLIEQVVADGPLHALVNNAGVYVPLDFAGATDEEFEDNLSRTLAVNFVSPLRLTRAAVAHFSRTGGGKILNVASRVGFKGEAGASIYAASKAALINLTRSLAVELAPNNIGLFGIAPGWVDTAMVRDGMDERLASIIATLPLGRMASPEDCAAAAAFLLSDEASYLSGQVIDINGASYFH